MKIIRLELVKSNASNSTEVPWKGHIERKSKFGLLCTELGLSKYNIKSQG